MDAFSVSAASGLRARLESLEMIANNLANQGSPGFKMDRELYSLYLAPEAQAPEDAGVVGSPTAPVIERHWTDLSQGVLRNTEEPFDFALSGPGFFVVESDRGRLLTRNGNFRLTPDGQLQTQDGYAVLDTQNRPIQLNARVRTEVTAGGEILQGGQIVARLAVVGGAEPGSLTKTAGTYFQATQMPTAATAAQVLQGRLEASNQHPAEGAVRLISVMRQFESLTKAVQIHAEMNRRADDIARVTG